MGSPGHFDVFQNLVAVWALNSGAEKTVQLEKYLVKVRGPPVGGVPHSCPNESLFPYENF